MKHIALVTVAVVLLVAGDARAQGTNFSGNWKMNAAASNFGGMPAPSSLTQKITHEEPSVKVTSAQTGDFGDMNADFTFTTDGTECINKFADFVVRSTLKWDGPVLVVDSTMDLQGSPMTMSDRWSLSPDGTQMIIDRHVSGPMGAGDGKIVFDKQP